MSSPNQQLFQMRSLTIGARQSDLARLQAYLVGEAICLQNSSVKVEYSFKASLGDRNLTDPLWKMPDKGVFTEDFLADLRCGDVDIVVHSWKDLPTEDRPDTSIVATLPRADARDVLFVRKDRVGNLNGKLRVYSSSPRRAHNLRDFLKTHFPLKIGEVEFLSVRGNVPTRFKKFLSDDIDGFVMAKAALDRLLSSPVAEFRDVQKILREQIALCLWSVLPLRVNPAAAAQGALAIEILSNRRDLLDLLTPLNDIETYQNVLKEREILKSYGGGCHQKIGVTVRSTQFGALTSLRGLTDSGEVLDRWELSRHLEWPSFEPQELWPLRARDSQFFDRREQVFDPRRLAGKNVWVAKAEALPLTFFPDESTAIWTSGLETWRQLSERGIWVNGSSEGLGEQISLGVDHLNQRPWIKVSHSDSEEVSKFPLVTTYKLIPRNKIPDLSGKKCFFWMSGSSFREAIKHYPEILAGHHACGAGNTYQILSKMIGDEARLKVFLDFNHWFAEMTKGLPKGH